MQRERERAAVVVVGSMDITTRPVFVYIEMCKHFLTMKSICM